MVLWRGRPDEVEPSVLLARFRRTRRQLLARRLYLGMLASLGVLALLGAGLLMRCVSDLPVPARLLLVAVAAGLVPVLLGLLGGLFGAPDAGADVDDLGVRRMPPLPGSFAPWEAIVELRTERRGGRTMISLYLDSGVVIRMRAPYDGRLLAGDPEFERKLFTLRNLWESHRRWNIP